ncbi:hypothetical protein Q4Q35_11935 [Flavivirga aquimarina]|uniref:Uncharacterized protein n=1 Tax=Flavivirga aquimarina TaxID=2027862 RepID=A0ABT8WBJ6_9FLAO|nr:hypothetical protein [Flavivirga aquimarina]MDO5970517.1 hypothetical protein [Flavivirga aquimarina]
MKELILKSKEVNLIATNLDTYPKTIPFVTFSSEGSDFTIQIIAIVPYIITDSSVKIDGNMQETDVMDRNEAIEVYEVSIGPAVEPSEHTVNVYWIEIKYEIDTPHLDNERIFVKFEELNTSTTGMPETNRGTVITTSKPK